MGQIDKTADVLTSLRLAMNIENKQDIVINVVECILIAFTSASDETSKDCETINREQFVQKMNYFIGELKKLK